jgi:hypothetical protein
MNFEDNGRGESVPPRHTILHYHGDEVRVLFFASAIVLIVAKSTGAELALSTLGTVIVAVLLVIAAGITNPVQYGIHWMNAVMAILGALFFGTTAVDNYRAGISLFDPSFIYVEVLAILSLVALYFTIRTIRGLIQRKSLS